MIDMQTQRIYSINTLIIINFFNCDVSNVVNINVFVRLFVNFSQACIKIFEIDNIIVKIISSIFIVNFFDLHHLYLVKTVFNKSLSEWEYQTQHE